MDSKGLAPRYYNEALKRWVRPGEEPPPPPPPTDADMGPFYLVTDCAASSEGADAQRFETQHLLNAKLATFREKTNVAAQLPLYYEGRSMSLKRDQLYKTKRRINEWCCYCYVIRTNKVLRVGEGCTTYKIALDKAMWDEMFRK